MPADFRTLFEAQLVALVVPDSAALAAKVDVQLSIDGYPEYEGEPDQTTTTSLDVSITGYDEFGKVLWNFSREYEGSRAPMTLLDAMARVVAPPVSNCSTDSRGRAQRRMQGAGVEDALAEYVEATLAAALIDAGRRPDAANKIAEILTPTVTKLATDPIPAASGCDHCEGTVTEHESHCMRGR